MKCAQAKWPSKAMKGKWRVGKYLRDPIVIVSEATGHNFISIELDCELSEVEAEKIAQHIVDLHNSQLRK